MDFRLTRKRMDKTIDIGFLSGSDSKSKACSELNRRLRNLRFGVAMSVILILCGDAAHAQPAKKIPRIGYFSLSAGPSERD